MSIDLNTTAPSVLLPRLADSDRVRLGEALQALLSRGSILGLEPGSADLYAWCRLNLEWLRELAALSGLAVFNDHESRLIQALPKKSTMTLRLKQDATIVLLALWYEFDTQVRDQGATRVVCTVEELNELLRDKLLPDLREPPSRGRLTEILRMADRFNLIRIDLDESMEKTRIEILPTLKRVIPFQDLADWARAAEAHRSPATSSPRNDEPPVTPFTPNTRSTEEEV